MNDDELVTILKDIVALQSENERNSFSTPPIAPALGNYPVVWAKV